ncbi:MAG: hypothetical protein KJZ54_02750 [Phycisphaerales bacterium]|nr:hypothetical protein [Phycisphaerales bacterium]
MNLLVTFLVATAFGHAHAVPIRTVVEDPVLTAATHLSGGGYTLTARVARLAFAPEDSAADAAPPCPADLDGDGLLTGEDLLLFQGAFLAGGPEADFNCDGVVNTLDFVAFLNAFTAGCD